MYRHDNSMSLLDTFLSDGLHMCNNWDDIPPDQIDSQGNCLSITYLHYVDLGQYWGRRIYFPANDGNAIYVNVCSAGVWQGWELVAPATKPQEFNLPLAEGWSAMPSCKASYFKTQESVVCVTLNVVPDHAIASQETICILPASFRPAHLIKVPVVAIMQDGTNDVGYCDIDLNGIVQIYNITGEVFELEISIATFVAAD